MYKSLFAARRKWIRGHEINGMSAYAIRGVRFLLIANVLIIASSFTLMIDLATPIHRHLLKYYKTLVKNQILVWKLFCTVDYLLLEQVSKRDGKVN